MQTVGEACMLKTTIILQNIFYELKEVQDILIEFYKNKKITKTSLSKSYWAFLAAPTDMIFRLILCKNHLSCLPPSIIVISWIYSIFPNFWLYFQKPELKSQSQTKTKILTRKIKNFFFRFGWNCFDVLWSLLFTVKILWRSCSCWWIFNCGKFYLLLFFYSCVLSFIFIIHHYSCVHPLIHKIHNKNLFPHYPSVPALIWYFFIIILCPILFF